MIATPTSTHASLIETAVRAGKAVWSEKPIALNIAETQGVVELVKATSIPVQLGFMRRFDPGYLMAKERIESGALGRLEAFFQALGEGITPTPGPTDALETLRLAVAVTRSWRDGCPVRVADVTS